MRQRKSNLDLGLHPCMPLPCSSSSSSDATSFTTTTTTVHQQHVTILHNGRACAVDLTELQARAILMLARREAEARIAKSPASSSSDGSVCYLWSPSGLSMKRSLQRFLQGRRRRRARAHAQEISPCNNLSKDRN